MCHLTRRFHVNSSLALNLLPKRGPATFTAWTPFQGTAWQPALAPNPFPKLGIHGKAAYSELWRVLWRIFLGRQVGYLRTPALSPDPFHILQAILDCTSSLKSLPTFVRKMNQHIKLEARAIWHTYERANKF